MYVLTLQLSTTQYKLLISRIIKICQYFTHQIFVLSKLASSESQGQEEAACTRPANATTGVLFTGTNAVKFPSTVTLVILRTTT